MRYDVRHTAYGIWRSEGQPQRPLHHARRTRGVDLSEGRILLNAARVKTRDSVYAQPLGMVEGVVYLPTELQAPRLALKRDILEEREVPVVRARIAEDVFRRVPEIASRRARKRRRIDPLHEAGGGDFLLIVREIRIANDDYTSAIA